uniref:RRM domain-containing protein n=1 Tax=Tanacetum cinerariifolium TaxID=118510 RepID=A0A6L2KYA8_TANCI|nr:hypothetical protein [Tanacetum cinerariifolium]
MGINSFADDVNKIFTSIFVTNFPDQFYAKDLWRVCEQYGNVVDAFIPHRGSKVGKRFGFVRFIRVLDIDRLVNNLCTIWVDRWKLYANKVRFHRLPLNKVTKGTLHQGNEYENKPALVLDDSCFNQQDFSKSLIGKVKEYSSLTNLKFIEEDENEVEKVSETTFMKSSSPGEKENNFNTGQNNSHSEDPFNIYGILNKKHDTQIGDSYSKSSMKYPPRFTPSCDDDFHIAVEKQEDGYSQIMKDDKMFFGEINTDHSNNKKDDLQDKGESMCSGHFKRMDVPCTGGSMIQLMDGLVKVGLGQKTKKDWVKELCINNKVNFLSLQETKMEEMQLFNIKVCWGNFNFDHTYSPSVGASSGILCVWDPKMFSKNNHTILDYFIMAVINNWNGDVVIMGDFNELRYQAKRYGSVFNNQGAEAFNSFIDNAGLEEIHLGGCSFTWCHKSATNMSKLDRFLIFKNLMNSNQNITAVTFDRYLSDHRPIPMRKAHFDYGPISFCFFHYWFEFDGFDAFHLKDQMRVWIKDKKEKDNSSKNNLKKDLHNINLLLNKGETNLDDIKKIEDIRKALQDFEQLKLKEVAQKAKIKWAIEGDENLKYYHRILNKRRNHLAIRGVMADGTWLVDPNLVKAEFLAYFSTRFEEPKPSNIHLNLEFPYKLNEDQKKTWSVTLIVMK